MKEEDIDFIKNNTMDIFGNKISFDEKFISKCERGSKLHEDENYNVYEMSTPKGKMFINISKFGSYEVFKTLEAALGYIRMFKILSDDISENLIDKYKEDCFENFATIDDIDILGSN